MPGTKSVQVKTVLIRTNWTKVFLSGVDWKNFDFFFVQEKEYMNASIMRESISDKESKKISFIAYTLYSMLTL